MSSDERKSRINALHQLLRNTDYRAHKYAEGCYAEEEYAEFRMQRQAWRNEINELETQLSSEEVSAQSVGGR